MNMLTLRVNAEHLNVENSSLKAFVVETSNNAVAIINYGSTFKSYISERKVGHLKLTLGTSLKPDIDATFH